MFPGRGERLRLARAKARLTQAELAARIGTDQSTVSEWENNDGPRIRRANLLALARELATTVEWLERGEGADQLRESRQPSYIAINDAAEVAAARVDALAAELLIDGLVDAEVAALLRGVATRIREGEPLPLDQAEAIAEEADREVPADSPATPARPRRRRA